MTELDELTLRRAQGGDHAALEAFVRRYAPVLHALLRRSGLGADTEDRLQELLSRLLEALPRFRSEGPATLTTWVFTIAQRWLIDVSRKRKLHLAPLEAGRAVIDPGPRADQLLERQQLGRRVELALETLPLDQRRVFVLAQVHQRPLQEIADTEGVPVGTVKSRLHRARAALVENLAPVLGEHGGHHVAAR
jgi:RNA polymerase sigma-70 factor (ECF subfamily)